MLNAFNLKILYAMNYVSNTMLKKHTINSCIDHISKYKLLKVTQN